MLFHYDYFILFLNIDYISVLLCSALIFICENLKVHNSRIKHDFFLPKLQAVTESLFLPQIWAWNVRHDVPQREGGARDD